MLKNDLTLGPCLHILQLYNKKGFSPVVIMWSFNHLCSQATRGGTERFAPHTQFLAPHFLRAAYDDGQAGGQASEPIPRGCEVAEGSYSIEE